MRHLALVDLDSDELVGHPAHVIAPGRVERLEAELDALRLPALEYRLRYGSVQQPPEGRTACRGDPRERGVGRLTDPDVVGVVEDAVRPKRAHDGRSLGHQHRGNGVDELVERHLVERAVGVAEPLVPVGLATESAPAGLVLEPADAAQRLAGGREPVADVAAAAVGRVDQGEAEARVVGMHCHHAGHPVRIIVRVGHHDGEAQTLRHGISVAQETPAFERVAA